MMSLIQNIILVIFFFNSCIYKEAEFQLSEVYLGSVPSLNFFFMHFYHYASFIKLAQNIKD